MSDFVSMALGVVVGGAISKPYTTTVGKVEERQRKLGEQAKETSRKLAAAGDVVRYRGELDRLRAKQVGATQSSKTLGIQIAGLEVRYDKARRELASYGVEVGDAARAQRRFSRELRATERAQRALGRRQAAGARLGRMRNLALGGVGAVYGVGRMFEAAMERERLELNLGTVINAEDGDQQAAVGRAVAAARRQARTSLASVEEVLQIEYQLNSAGLDEQAARAASKVAHRVATVTGGEGADVGNVIGGIFNTAGDQFAGGLEQRIRAIGDLTAAVQAKYQITDFGQLGEGLKEAVGAANTFGLRVDDAAVVVGHLNSNMIQGSQAGTALGAVLRNLSKAEKDLGAKVVRDDDGQLDLLATLENIAAATRGLAEGERADALQKIFGEEGLKGIAPMLGGLDDLRDGMRQIAAAAGNVDTKYATFLRSSSGAWTMLKQNMGDVGTVAAGILLPSLSALTRPLGSLAAWVGGAVERWPQLTRWVGIFAGALIAGAAAVALVTAATWAWNAALLLNPMVWLGGLVVGVAAAIYLAWEPIKKFFAGVWNTEGIQRWVRRVGDVVRAVKSFLRWVGLIDNEETPATTVGATEDAAVGATQTRRSRRGKRRGTAAEDGPVVGTATRLAKEAPEAESAPKVGAAVAAPARPPEAESAPKVSAAVAAVGVAVGAALPAAAQPEAPPPLPAFAQTLDVVPPPAFAAPIHAPPPAPATTSSVRVNASIVVNPPAGADEQAIAREVRRQIEQVRRRAEVEAGLGESDA